MERDFITENRLKKALFNCSFFSCAQAFECVGSTNDVAKELGENGAEEGTVVLAKTQTAGRGRMGRRFYSPDNSGLYMSLLLRPVGCDSLGLITAGAAVAMRRAIYEMIKTKVDIKWVNDLLFQNKKLCGILAEGRFRSDGSLSYVVLGVGVNLSMPQAGYAEEIKDKTISLKEIAPEYDVETHALASAFIQQFAKLYQALPNTDFLMEYRQASCLLGKEITYQKAGKLCTGRAIEIDDAAQLVVLSETGEKQVLSMGEVHFVRKL